jgi:vacuolar-type H+-ATPase subunit H
MDLIAELDAIIEEIRNAKNVPLSASAMINRQDMLEKLEAVKQNAPEELKQARWVMRDRDEVLSRSQREAEKMLTEARTEHDRLVAKTDIVAAANREGDKIIDEAKARAREIRMEAEDYVDAKLASFEVVLQKTLAAVVKGRESLRGRLESSRAEMDELEAAEELEPEVSETGNVRLRRP